MIKVYRALNYRRLVTEVDVGGRCGVIEFRQRDSRYPTGTFSTENTMLQKAIESDAQYGKEFILAHKIRTKKASPQTPKPQNDDKG